ncbi:unnamed protein product [Amoebophrya sp. A25]|nr:unnamed protein product [Amoebophrya sp. A25]|eukprot:GSA25T00026391001.1
MNGIDTSILTRKQVEELLRQRPLTMRFATKKILKKSGNRVPVGGYGGLKGGGGKKGKGKKASWGEQEVQASTSSNNAPGAPTPRAGHDNGSTTTGASSQLKNEMSLSTQLAPEKKCAWAGLSEGDDMREARRRRFEAENASKSGGPVADLSGGADAKRQKTDAAGPRSTGNQVHSGGQQQAQEQEVDGDDEELSDEEEVVTIGPVSGKSINLEKSYLRLTSEAKASDVRPLEVLKQAFSRLQVGEDTANKSWNYVSDQLRAIRQDLLVQNLNNSDFAVQVYSANAIWALHYKDLGQFHQCAMQLKSIYKTRNKQQEKMNKRSSNYTKNQDQLELDAEADEQQKEFRILRGVYNVFMGLDHIESDRLHPVEDKGILLLVDAFRCKLFPKFFRLRKKTRGPLADLCSCFDNLFRCEAILRYLQCLKIEKPNLEVISWFLGEEEEEIDRFFRETALIKNWTSIAKPSELAEKLRNSVAMNIRHQMK